MAKSSKKPLLAVGPTLALAATLLTFIQGWAAEPHPSAKQRPQLVLSIVVDGLNSEYLELLGSYFGPDGINKLMANGLVLDRVEYGSGIDGAGALAMLYSGAEPAVNGIATATTYSTERKLPQPTLLDPTQLGNFTDETLSPAALRVSTIADEVRIDGAGAGYVYAIAPDAPRAILMAGHAGNSAVWINDANGQWATTTYYRDLPAAINADNYTHPLSARIDTICWSPMLNLADYPGLPAQKRYYPFRHTFNGQNKFRDLKASASGNREITNMAEEYIRSMSLGSRDAIDMLSVGYTVSGLPGDRVETMDAYLRLDRDIARLINAAEAAGPTMVLLAGTPAPASTEPDDPKWQLNTGEFSARKALSLLNMYLIARHGNGEWVTGYDRGAFFLNRKQIESQNIDIEELRQDAAKFLMQMTGVANAYTLDDILEGRRSPQQRRNTVVASAPDVFIDVIPGWILIDDVTEPHNPLRTTVRASASIAPAFIYAPGMLEPTRLSTPVDARSIAPTVARLLRIRSPNAAAQPPVSYSQPIAK